MLWISSAFFVGWGARYNDYAVLVLLERICLLYGILAFFLNELSRLENGIRNRIIKI